MIADLANLIQTTRVSSPALPWLGQLTQCCSQQGHSQLSCSHTLEACSSTAVLPRPSPTLLSVQPVRGGEGISPTPPQSRKTSLGPALPCSQTQAWLTLPLQPMSALLCYSGEVQGLLQSAAASLMTFFKGLCAQVVGLPHLHSHSSFHGCTLLIVSIIVIRGVCLRVAMCPVEGHTCCNGRFCVVSPQA